jgi:hypothetical protein
MMTKPHAPLISLVPSPRWMEHPSSDLQWETQARACASICGYTFGMRPPAAAASCAHHCAVADCHLCCSLLAAA